MVKNQQSTNAGVEQFITGSVISKDGTKISYRQSGHGPGLLVVHGAMESAESHRQLAEALAPDFTVYLYDRRGRGMSGPFGKDYCMRKEVEDIDALLTQTGAHFIFGISSGGLITLRAACFLTAIHKAAVYDPALSVHGSVSTAFVRRYDREIAEGKVSAALVTGMKGSHMGPPIFNVIPRPVLEFLTTLQLQREDKKARPEDVTWRKLAPTIHYDFQLVEEMSDALESFGAIQVETLLLGGGASPAFLKVALNALEPVIPHQKRIEFPGFNHGAAGNKEFGGQPERVAQELRQFFAG